MADLEQRVQALEQELQILKNQIQVILLDIQEQVLSNTYPSLRAGDNHPPAAPPSSRPRPDAEDSPRASSVVRSMSFDDMGDEEDDQPVVPQPRPAAKPAKRNNASQLQAISELEDWAAKKIEMIGAQDTMELINTYAAKGRFSPEEADALMDFVSLHPSLHNEMPTQPTPPNRPFELAARPPQNARAQSVSAAPARAEQPSVPVPEAKPQKPSKKSGKAAPVQQTQEPTPPAPASDAKPVEEPKKQESKNVVLRLIAGVQNAGAGVRWGKHDG